MDLWSLVDNNPYTMVRPQTMWQIHDFHLIFKILKFTIYIEKKLL